MDIQKINQILEDTAYVHTSGTPAERKAAEYLADCCRELGIEAHLEAFEVDMATMHEAVFEADGVSIPCKGYLCAGSGEVEAPFYYLRSDDAYSLKQVKGKVVMIDSYLRRWMYQDLLDNGAVGLITFDGNANYADRDIDQRELRAVVSLGNKIPCVNINAKDAIALVEKGVNTAKIVLKQDEYKGESQNVVMELPGEIDEWIVLTAHYDTTSLSQGAYDNMSGCLGLLGIAEAFVSKPHRYGLRFVFCGSEERGLLGSKAYVKDHENELDKMALNINLDMIGCIMGKFIACCTCEEKLVHYIEYFANEIGFGLKARQDVYSSDSTPFADKGVPAVSFARLAPPNTATIHNSYDTRKVMKAEQVQEDVAFLVAFTDRMANAKLCPVSRTIPDSIKEKLDYYLLRKRKPE
ncbi:MAG: DUF4910 domain-containing protein [Clostridia bacterium]|nr:DUF4910 domain-containing protein [Clostridia bacterium]